MAMTAEDSSAHLNAAERDEALDLLHRESSKRQMSVAEVMARVALIVAAVELAIMLGLSAVELGIGVLPEALLDTGLLVALSTPLIYFLVARPFIDLRNHALSRAARLAMSDGLTGLANRRFFEDLLERRIAEARRHGRLAAMLLVDLDDFKLINDGYGHAAGDAVLVEVGARLRAMCREEDMVARVGGDEFALLLAPVEHPDEAGHDALHAKAIALRDAVSAPIRYRGLDLCIGASIGIRLVEADTNTASVYLRDADAAMYDAKRSGKGAVVLFGGTATRTVQG